MPTGSMSTTRSCVGFTAYTATGLLNGQVLIVGGGDKNCTPLDSAEVYDQNKGIFSPTGSLNTAREDHTATLLQNGQVLVAGGNGNICGPSGCAVYNVELYNSATGTFAVTASAVYAAWLSVATLLKDGRVLIAGGLSSGGIFNGAQLYDPSSGTFTAAGYLISNALGFTATLLNDGRVLIAGGEDMTGFGTASAELYDPASGNFIPTGSMSTLCGGHTATLLNNGKVLIAGGGNGLNPSSPSAELYDPASGTFSPTKGDMVTPRFEHTATLLPDGKVLIAGGENATDNPLSGAELYDPASDTFSPTTGDMVTPRWGHTATLLPNGEVLITGGFDKNGNPLSSAELYLESVITFIHPIEPWIQSGSGFGDDWNGNNNKCLCFTNRTCDPSGPRCFKHLGFDAKAVNGPGTLVKASANGVVVRIVKKIIVNGSNAGGIVVLEHDLDGNPKTTNDRVTTVYQHVDSLVKVGDIVKQGDVIAKVSNITGPHLHFGFRRAPFDPKHPSDSLRGALPPPGTNGCQPCFGHHVKGGLPAFPEKWEDPQIIF